MTIRVNSARGSSTVEVSTAGKYISFPVNGVTFYLPREPVQPTGSVKVFWQSVLAIVTAQVNALT